MYTCAGCFNPEASPVDLITDKPQIGTCDFCSGDQTDVWQAEIWADAFSLVIDAYEVSDPPEIDAIPLPQRLQEDWKIFASGTAASGRIADFLTAVFPAGHELLRTGVVVRARMAHDHAKEWEEFVGEISNTNRYFPTQTLDQDFMTEMIRENVKDLIEGPLYRSRIQESVVPFGSEQMGRPPQGKATAGRANPMGISHLYLSDELETSIRESRAYQHCYVSVATFRLLEVCQVLDLASLQRENPFKIVDDGLASKLDYWRLLERLGDELARPARSTDNQLEYIPTQYLSELVKSMGVHGIRYKSSLHPGGRNIVLFNDERVEVSSSVACYEITGASLSYDLVTA